MNKEWKDPKTKLIWSAEEPILMTWQEAINHENTLDNGWRLPTIEELETLIDRRTYDPAMRKGIPFRDSSYYWSSTTYAYYTTNAWSVNFYYGYVYSGNKSNYYYVRCVRSGQ